MQNAIGSDSSTSAREIFGRSCATEPDASIEQLNADDAIAEAVLTHIAPAIGWQ